MTAMRSLRGPLTAILVITGLAASFVASSADAQQPPREGCRAVSKLEYTTAKNENVIISKGGRYVRTGPFWRRQLLALSSLIWEATMGQWLIADFSVSDIHVQALDVPGSGYRAALVPLRLGNAINC